MPRSSLCPHNYLYGAVLFNHGRRPVYWNFQLVYQYCTYTHVPNVSYIRSTPYGTVIRRWRVYFRHARHLLSKPSTVHHQHHCHFRLIKGPCHATVRSTVGVVHQRFPTASRHRHPRHGADPSSGILPSDGQAQLRHGLPLRSSASAN